MPHVDIDYDKLPQRIKDNISEDQWPEAQREVIPDGESAPDTGYYINLKNGQIHEFSAGDAVSGPVLPVHDLAGAGGKNDSQFESTSPGAHPAPGAAPRAAKRGWA
jgi:hypothetical protein